MKAMSATPDRGEERGQSDEKAGHVRPRLFSITSQISAAMSGPPKRLTSRMPVGEVTLISVR